MIIGSVSENKDIEKRISITPELVKKYFTQGFKILIEKDYGTHLGFTNEKYQQEGCEINTRNYVIEKSDGIERELEQTKTLQMMKRS